MKEEIIFVGVIILLLAIWKLSELIQMSSTMASSPSTSLAYSNVTEGMTLSPDERSKTENIISQTDKILAEANELIQKNKALNSGGDKQGLSLMSILNPIKMVTTEGYTSATTEHEMTIHQRNQAKTALDAAAVSIGIESTQVPAVREPIIVPEINIKEGLENAEDGNIINKKLTSLNMEDNQSKFKLRDYFIKSSYNSFNPDNFKNSTVSMDAGLYVIARGCRCIDFEVFSVDNQPVIGSSSVNSFNYKETYNHIPVSEAFEALGNYAFSGAKCPNPQDPFIIHMRIMSQNITMYDNLAKIITTSKSFARNLLDAKYGREYHSKDLGDEDLKNFFGKIILMVDATNKTYRSTKLFELINMSSGSLFLSKYTFFGVKNVGDPQMFKEANKKNMCLVVPEKSGRPVNDGHNASFTWGCQIVAMCFQDAARDEKLKAYEDKFDSVGYAFVLKPEDLRYVPITIGLPAPPNPKASMEGRSATTAGGVKIVI
jgi:hypothetical protein